MLLPTLGVTTLAVATILVYAVGDFGTIVRRKPDPAFALARQIEAIGASSPATTPEAASIRSAIPARLAARIDRNAGAYWAHLAGLRIVADVDHPEDYWNGDALTRERVMQTFAELGIRVVIGEIPGPSRRSRSPSVATVPSASLQGWTAVPGTGFYIYEIRRP